MGSGGAAFSACATSHPMMADIEKELGVSSPEELLPFIPRRTSNSR
jgi:hypothetical protein